ncbi:MAG: DNA polymerase-3 subunit delta', partial [Candidatus Paceibacteria bacterium]
MRELLNKDKLHHAYVLEGEREHIYEKICQFCEEDLKLAIKANPDFWYQESDKFLIQNARDLREMQLRKTLGDSRKIFIIAFNFITREAQNSLLKVLEEPTEGTHIFIITPSSSVFLDTVLSRVTVLKNEGGEGTTDAKKFLNATYGERINMVTKLVKDIKA